MSNIESDNRFALAILESTVQSKECKAALQKSAYVLHNIVVKPILTKLLKEIDLSEEEKKTMAFLAREHSKGGMQWGGCMRKDSQQNIMANSQSQLLLLQT